MTYGDGPSLEELSLLADLAEVADERDQARAELAAAQAEIRELRVRLAAVRHAGPSRRPVKVG